MNETPVNETPVNETPVNELPVNELPINETPVNELGFSDARSGRAGAREHHARLDPAAPHRRLGAALAGHAARDAAAAERDVARLLRADHRAEP